MRTTFTSQAVIGFSKLHDPFFDPAGYFNIPT